MNTAAKLYLIPVPITEESLLQHIPQHNLDILKGLVNFVAEDEKTARRFLKAFGYPHIGAAKLFPLNEHSGAEDLAQIRQLLAGGTDIGLMSDAGCPGIADPGAAVVEMAHNLNIQVVPLAGPSSIVLSIMASGFNGQNFAFVGYLPIDKQKRSTRLRDLEKQAQKNKQAQYFIETPYRNEQLFETLMSVLSPATFLFIGRDIGSNAQLLKSRTIADWKKQPPASLHKQPVVWGIYS